MQTLLEHINQRERQVLVHSFLYYQLNSSIVSDHDFDRWSMDIVRFKENHPDVFKQSAYYEAFKDFDGSSGYDLPYSHPEIQSTGYRLLQYEKKMRQSK